MWAGMSSGPSEVCVQRGKSSGTTTSNHDSKSRRTSGEAFSFSVSDALVWRMWTCSRPALTSATSGSASATSRVTRWKPRGRGSSVTSREIHIVPPVPRHPQIDTLAAERHALGVEALALAVALGQRPVGAHHAPPRDRVAELPQHGPAEPRRARREVAVGAHEALGDLRDLLEDLAIA